MLPEDSERDDVIRVWEHSNDFDPIVIEHGGTFLGWTHVTLVYSNRVPSLFVNGNLAALGSQSSRNPVYPSNGQALTPPPHNQKGGFGGGEQLGGAGYYFPGRIDDIRIYNRALPDSEVRQLYDFESGTWVPPFTNGLVVYYPFNGNANDESGNGNIASISGAVLTADRFGVANKAFHFSGAGDHMSASVAAIPLGNSPRTIVAWLKPDDSSLINGIIHHGRDDCTGLMFGLSRGRSYLGNDNLGFWGGCRDYASSLIIPSNQWSFVALTYDGSNIRLYANGQSESNAIGPLNTQNSHLWIGAETLDDGGSFRDFFKGAIDEVRFYNRALSYSEVQQLYVYESGPRVSLIKAVKPSFSGLSLGANYQLQVSGDMNNWTNQGSVFTATNVGMIYPQYWDVDNWGQLFFRLQAVP